jgi:hypothetical protein
MQVQLGSPSKSARHGDPTREKANATKGQHELLMHKFVRMNKLLQETPDGALSSVFSAIFLMPVSVFHLERKRLSIQEPLLHAILWNVDSSLSHVGQGQSPVPVVISDAFLVRAIGCWPIV